MSGLDRLAVWTEKASSRNRVPVTDKFQSDEGLTLETSAFQSL